MRARTALAAVAAALVVTGCSAGTDRGAASGQRPALDPAADPGVAHVHGLGVDPADGVLYAATHFGLFALPEDGSAERIADRLQDTMGFTVVGPNTFLGSGHPDPEKDPELPPRLGLIRSTDAARTWQTVSLTGEVDFHALHSAHGSIYGWDSGTGRLMVSADDGATWDTRSTLGLRDFAVSPADPQVLLATTEQGLARSTDGGRSFTAVTGAPVLAVLAWQRSDQLYGVDPGGQVHTSRDGGRTWGERGSLEGPPEALAAYGDELFATATGKGILASADGGRSWTVRYSDDAAS
jgi:hypothetical protein